MRSAIIMISLALMGCNGGGGSDPQPTPTSRVTSDTPGTAPIVEAPRVEPVEPVVPIAPEPREPIRAYLVGASFEHCPLNGACDGPRTAQHLAAQMADTGDVLIHDGRPGEYLADQYASAQWWAEFRARTETDHEQITAAVLGLANDALRDAQTQSLDSIEAALAVVEVLQQLAPVVLVLDYPPMAGRDLPALTVGMGIDPVWWDETFRPAYRAAMESAGAHVIGAYADWEPTNAERPGQLWPDYHLSDRSAKRAATRIYLALEQWL